MSTIEPPERSSAIGTVLVVVLLTLFTLVLHLPAARLWLLAAIALLTAVAIWQRQAHAVNCGLLGLLTIIAFTTPAAQTAWPASGLLIVGLYTVVARRTRLLGSSFGWARVGRPTLTELVISMAIGVLSFLGVIVWVRLARPDLAEQAAAVPEVSIAILVLLAVAFAVINSLVEEMLFRGVFMYALEAALGIWPAVVLQAVSFGLLHTQGFPRGPYGMLLAGVVGLVLAWLRLRTRGMVAPWLAHAIANGLMYLYLAR
jgi:membrane protease YdiL (CAAX protease family)